MSALFIAQNGLIVMMLARQDRGLHRGVLVWLDSGYRRTTRRGERRVQRTNYAWSEESVGH
jgi:hypothetical protein